jgi:hypothetical protein
VSLVGKPAELSTGSPTNPPPINCAAPLSGSRVSGPW